MDIGGNIRKARKIRGLTQIDVAEMAEIAVNSLRLYEAGKRTPNLEQLQHIARAIGVEWPSLVDGDFIWDDETTVDIPARESFIENMRRGAKVTPLEKERISLEESNRLLVALGLIEEGQDLSDTDLAFLKNIIEQMEIWFSNRRQRPQEGKDTTPPPDAPETPPEGK